LPGIVLLAAALRLYRLGALSFWLDEVDTLYAGLYRVFLHPPLFPTLTALWSHLGRSEGWLRLLSVFFGVGAVYFAYRLASSMAGREAGLWAAGLMAVSPPAVYYSRELRMYVAMVALGLVSWECWFGWLELGGRRRWLAAGLLQAALLYTHNYALFLVAGQALSALVAPPRWRSLRRAGASLALAGVVYLPYFRVFLFYARRMARAQFWAPRVDLGVLAHTWRVLTSSYECGLWHRRVLGLLIALLVLRGLVGRGGRRVRWLLVFGVLVPVGLAALNSILLPTSLYVARYLLFVVGPLLVVAGVGLAELPGRVKPAVGAAVAALSFWAIGYQYANVFAGGDVLEARPRKDYRGAAEYILERWQPGDVVGTTCESGSLPLWYYLTWRGGRPHGYQFDLEGTYRELFRRKYDVDEIIARYPFIAPVEIEEAVRGARRIWLYASQWNIGQNPADPFYRHRIAVTRWLALRYRMLDYRQFYGVDVYLFDPAGPPEPEMVPIR
jgi:hypothetical protein